MCSQALCDEILALCADIHRAEDRLLELIFELDRARPWRHQEIPSCAHWLNVHCGLDLVTAREKVRIAHALPKLPLIREAFRRGEISYSKVRAITRVAEWHNEVEVLELAKAHTAAHVAAIVKSRRQAERLKESKVAFDAYRSRTFTCYTDDTGTLVFEGRLPADQGALLLQALDRGVEWLFHDQPDFRHRRYPHEASLEDVPQETRRADALAILAERFLSAPPRADEGLNTADRYQVTVHASAEALPEYGELEAEDAPHVEDGPVLATETVRRLACDSAVVRILETGEGEPLDVGRKTRVIPLSIRRALKRRDRGCKFPNCTNTRFVDGHHITHWADGGTTSLPNLVLLCRHHHRLLHEGGYYVVKDGAHFLFCRGDGKEIPTGPETPITALIARAQSRMIKDEVRDRASPCRVVLQSDLRHRILRTPDLLHGNERRLPPEQPGESVDASHCHTGKSTLPWCVSHCVRDSSGPSTHCRTASQEVRHHALREEHEGLVAERCTHQIVDR